MKQKNKIIIFSILLLVILVTVILLVIKFKNNIDYELEDITGKVREVIDSVNYVNSLITSKKLDTKNKYTNETNNLTCYKYSAKDAGIFINVLNTIYENPFPDSGFYSTKLNKKDEEELYVCKPNCNVTTLTMDDVNIKPSDGPDKRVVTIYNKDYNISFIDGMWRLEEPIVLCEEDK